MPMTLDRIKAIEETALRSEWRQFVDGKYYTGLHLPVEEWVQVFRLLRWAAEESQKTTAATYLSEQSR